MTTHMLISRRSLLTALSMIAFSVGCKGDIGSECITNAQCQSGQTCDLISVGGYCTITPCTIGDCPDESVCVTFENEDRYCMASCESDDDCREGYRCDDDLGPAPFCRQIATTE